MGAEKTLKKISFIPYLLLYGGILSGREYPLPQHESIPNLKTLTYPSTPKKLQYKPGEGSIHSFFSPQIILHRCLRDLYQKDVGTGKGV